MKWTLQVLLLACFIFTGNRADLLCILKPPGFVLEQSLPRVNEQTNDTLKKIERGIDKQSKQEDEFLERFVRLPPQERIRLWKEEPDISGQAITQLNIEKALVAVGLDTAPYLAQIVHSGSHYHQVYAVRILCEMDRFVKLEDMVVPTMPNSISVKPLGVRGRLSPFVIVDGRRIGKVGYEAVKWAAEQTRNKDLQFHAREYSGLLDQELQKLSLDQVFSLWVGAVTRSKGRLGRYGNSDNPALSDKLEAVLIQRVPDSLPGLIEILDNENNEYVREELTFLLSSIDFYRLRLRATDVGREAIDAVIRALDKGKLKPGLSNRRVREDYRLQFIGYVNNDIGEIFDRDWARALNSLHGASLEANNIEIFQRQTVPELRQFVTYLTKIDPYFPSWVFTFNGPTRDAIMHPRFREKMNRYYEQWRRFRTDQGKLP